MVSAVSLKALRSVGIRQIPNSRLDEPWFSIAVRTPAKRRTDFPERPIDCFMVLCGLFLSERDAFSQPASCYACVITSIGRFCNPPFLLLGAEHSGDFTNRMENDCIRCCHESGKDESDRKCFVQPYGFEHFMEQQVSKYT